MEIYISILENSTQVEDSHEELFTTDIKNGLYKADGADDDNENTDFKYFEYIPPEGYCGAKRFIDEGLVKQSEPLFNNNIA